MKYISIFVLSLALSSCNFYPRGSTKDEVLIKIKSMQENKSIKANCEINGERAFFNED